jgi:integrase
MKAYKGSWNDSSGKVHRTETWYVRVRDHLGRVQRFAGYKDKAETERMGRQIEKLVAGRMNTDPPGPQLTKWLEGAPIRLKRRLVKTGVLDSSRAVGTKTLTEHLADYKGSMLARGLTAKQAGQECGRIDRITKDCGFRNWSDVRADRLEKYLADLRNGPKNLSARTSNGYLGAFSTFLRWMVQHRRASENPIACLKPLNEKVDRRHDRCAFEIDEVRRLLDVVEREPVRFGMTGHERAMLYKMTAETGLRANEARTLRVSSFDWKARTVTVQAGHSKHRKEDVLPLRPETVLELQTFFTGKLPTAKAFGGTYARLTDKTSTMLKADLAAAGIPYIDDAGRYHDFHALRHTCGSWLAAMGVHPKVVQAIMRHSDINLTMSRYCHTLRGQEAAAVGKLPDLNVGGPQQQKATGTDDVTASDNYAEISDILHAEQCGSVRDRAQCNGGGATENAVLTTPGRTRTFDLRIRNPLLYPTELRALKLLSACNVTISHWCCQP